MFRSGKRYVANQRQRSRLEYPDCGTGDDKKRKEKQEGIPYCEKVGVERKQNEPKNDGLLAAELIRQVPRNIAARAIAIIGA